MYGYKEPIYDEKIYPLMTEIIEICKEHKINMIASFQLGAAGETDDDNDFVCTTLLNLNEEHFPMEFKDFYHAIYQKPTVIAMTIKKGGAK